MCGRISLDCTHMHIKQTGMRTCNSNFVPSLRIAQSLHFSHATSTKQFGTLSGPEEGWPSCVNRAELHAEPVGR